MHMLWGGECLLLMQDSWEQSKYLIIYRPNQIFSRQVRKMPSKNFGRKSKLYVHTLLLLTNQISTVLKHHHHILETARWCFCRRTAHSAALPVNPSPRKKTVLAISKRLGLMELTCWWCRPIIQRGARLEEAPWILIPQARDVPLSPLDRTSPLHVDSMNRLLGAFFWGEGGVDSTDFFFFDLANIFGVIAT